MFIVLLTYTKPLELIEEQLIAHRSFLQTLYDQDALIASGPQVPN